MSHSPFCGILRSYGFFVYGYFSIAYFQEVVRMEWTFSDSVRLSLLSFSEASKACAALPGFSLFRRSLQPERIEYCRAELLPDCLVGSLAVPDKTHPLHLAFSLAFYLDRGQLILAADEQTLPALQSLLFPEEPLDTSDVFHLFFSFLESLIQEDMLYLQNFEKRLATIEESLLDTLPKELQRTLITIRRELLVFHAYYQQLLDMCEILSEDENHFLPPECARQFSRLGNRVDRLYDHTQMLREYALQIREMQQAQIDLRQNDTMRILTVVSTIFFPLSLIAGWYGMNFTHMPELSAPYAYFILISVCILIVAVEIWYFKKKGWF